MLGLPSLVAVALICFADAYVPPAARLKVNGFGAPSVSKSKIDLPLKRIGTVGGQLQHTSSASRMRTGASKKGDAMSVADASAKKKSYKKDVERTLAWVGAAAAFSVGIAYFLGTQEAIEFCSGYVLEYCLSVDNLFVFIVLFDYFNVKDEHMREKVLAYGIFGAVVLRGLFIGVGAVALQQFHQILLLFAGVLAYSSYKIIAKGSGEGEEEEEEDLENNMVVKLAKSVLSTSANFDGDNFFVIENGVKCATPLLLCLLCVELSDVVFAFDSVPAVFGITQNPLIVFSSNMFAIVGLRSLFGVLSQAVADLKYLEKAVRELSKMGFMFRLLFLCYSFVTFHIKWCIRKPCSSSIMLCNNSSIAHHHHTNKYPKLTDTGGTRAGGDCCQTRLRDF